jgi:hypothetical protein
MSSERKRGRPGCVEYRGGEYQFTELGLAHVREMAALGSSPSEIARYLRVSPDYIQKAIDPDSGRYREDIAEAYDEGASEHVLRLRKHQDALGETNAQMAIHLGKHFLGQKEDTQEINHNIRVVGTLPDYTASADDWKRQFAPSALQAVEAPKPSRANVIEAEVVEE